MAMSREEYGELFKSIAATGGFTDEMLDNLRKLKDEMDEREGMLQRYHEERDEASGQRAENTDEAKEEIREEGDTAERDEHVEWKEKYDDLRAKYIERFFTSPEEVKEDNAEDVRRDGNPQTYDELFERREG